MDDGGTVLLVFILTNQGGSKSAEGGEGRGTLPDGVQRSELKLKLKLIIRYQITRLIISCVSLNSNEDPCAAAARSSLHFFCTVNLNSSCERVSESNYNINLDSIY